MKVLNTYDFVSERIKIRPVTNAELEEFKKSSNYIPIKVNLSTLKSVDDLQFGWLLRTADGYIRVVLTAEYTINVVKSIYSIDYKWCFVKVSKEGIPGFLPSDSYDSTFPKYHKSFAYNTMFDITAVYKYTIGNLKNICKNEKSFVDWYISNIYDETSYIAKYLN